MGIKDNLILYIMPYQRRYKRTARRPYTKKRSVIGEFASGFRTAQKALSMAKYLKGLINVEYKKNDVAVTAGFVQPSTTGTITLLSSMAQGDTSETRNGNSIRSKSISIKGSVVAGTQTNELRYILFLDKNSNGVIPTATELLEADSVIARYNDDNMGSRFIILQDKRVPMGFNDTTNHYAAGDMNVSWSMYKKLFGHAKFDGTGAGQADAVSGHLYLYMVATANVGQHTITSRYEYIDN